MFGNLGITLIDWTCQFEIAVPFLTGGCLSVWPSRQKLTKLMYIEMRIVLGLVENAVPSSF